MNAESMRNIGWTDELATHMSFHGELTAARVVAEHRGSYVVTTGNGELRAEISGRLRHKAQAPQDLPGVGDWVALAARTGEGAGTIHTLLPRRTKFSRKVAGLEVEEQVLAANIDAIFVVTSLNSELNLRRIERYLTLGWQSGALPVVVLTKADIAFDVAGDLEEVVGVARAAPVHAVSALTGEGMEKLLTYFDGGRTVALLGSSGVGKSTLVNALAGTDVQRVVPVRADDKGRHTTTRRELIPLPAGGAVIDTPGMRELQMWDAADGVPGTFDDIEALAAGCRFRDCNHEREPGCAVKEALDEGRLDITRFDGYRKLERELLHLSRKKDARARAAESRKRKVMARDHRRASKPRADI